MAGAVGFSTHGSCAYALRTARGACLLLSSVIVKLTFPEAGLFRVLRDVALESFKMRGTPNQMVETLFLPESSFLPQKTVDLGRGKVLPGRTLGVHFSIPEQADQEMHVVWHHHKIAEVVT